MYYSLNGVLGVALSPTRVAICGHVYTVPANTSDPLSTLTRSDVDGVGEISEFFPEYSWRNEDGNRIERRQNHFQPKAQTLVGDVRLLDLHPGYPIPEADVVMIAPQTTGEIPMRWFKRTTLQWVDGRFYDGFGNDADGQPACNGSTFIPAETNDSGSIVMSNGRVVGFVSVVRDGGERLGIARLREEHRTMGLPEPAPVPVPPNPLPQPPASTPSPVVNPVVNSNMTTENILIGLGFVLAPDKTQYFYPVNDPISGGPLDMIAIQISTPPGDVIGKIISTVRAATISPVLLAAQRAQQQGNEAFIESVVKLLRK